MTIHYVFFSVQAKEVKTANSFSTKMYCNKHIVYEKV